MNKLAAFPAVAVTLWLLAAFSVATWALILAKAIQHVRFARADRRYATTFWQAPNLQAAADLPASDSALARLAGNGFNALRAAPQGAAYSDLEHSWDRHELLERNLRQQIKRERRTLDSGTAVLASIGSTAPFVGLFGTVWGIMHAMSDISRLGNASIDVVAGPIGEALIATAIGIGVAIPAVLAYNFFIRRSKSVVADLDDFANDFLNLAHRSTYRIERGIRPLDLRGDSRAENKVQGRRDSERAPRVVNAEAQS